MNERVDFDSSVFSASTVSNNSVDNQSSSGLSSTYSSSSESLEEQFPIPLVERPLTRRQSRNPLHLYTIHTYDDGLPAVIDKSFTFLLTRRISDSNVLTLNLQFRTITNSHPRVHEPRRCSYRFQGHSQKTVKIYILKGNYKNQHGIILKLHISAFKHRVLLASGEIVLIKQKLIRLLDPFFHLPYGIPYDQSLENY